MSRTRRLEPPTASGSVGVPERAPSAALSESYPEVFLDSLFW